jgi:hypothetical protein
MRTSERVDLLMRLCAHLGLHVRVEAGVSTAVVADRQAVNELVVMLARAAYAKWKRGDLLPLDVEPSVTQ